MRSDVLSKFHQHHNVSLELATLLPVCSNKIVWLAAPKAEERWSCLGNCLHFQICGAKRYMVLFRDYVAHTEKSATLELFQFLPKKMEVIKTRSWWTGGALRSLTLLRWLQPISHTADRADQTETRSSCLRSFHWLPTALRLKPKHTDPVYKALPPGKPQMSDLISVSYN